MERTGARIAQASAEQPDRPTPGGGATSAVHSPLLPAALALVPPSATADELAARFATVGAQLDGDLAEGLLGELMELGLVRASRWHVVGRRYVATSLGLRAIEAGLHPDNAIPLEELERLRTDLLSTIAHELRTPLTAVRTSVGLLLEPSATPTEEQRQQMLQSIERNAGRMQRLIGDILELSRFRAGSVLLQLRSFRAIGLAEAAVVVVAPMASKRGQTIEVVAAVPQEHAVYGDRRRLEQALINLIANAQRFSPDGGLVRVRVEQRGEMTAWSVADDGPGISDADQARLFERFFVGRTDRAAPREGVGLGLPTALAIAQAHGGSIEVDSEVGAGSTFTLVVPTTGPEDEP